VRSEVILTYDHDVVVEEFLMAAAKRRKFEVCPIACEGWHMIDKCVCGGGGGDGT
jgi:hypothetical protein